MCLYSYLATVVVYSRIKHLISVGERGSAYRENEPYIWKTERQCELRMLATVRPQAYWTRTFFSYVGANRVDANS